MFLGSTILKGLFNAMNKYKEEKIFEAPTMYAQYWHCNHGNRWDSGYDVKYITTTPNLSNNYRGIFTSDRDRIMYTTCFLRLSSKTQIFRVGSNDHLRTRLTHTLEVSQIARTIAKELGINIDLVEAIALGHDVGHTPFGHAGERQLNEISQNQLDNLKVKNFVCNKSADCRTAMNTTKPIIEPFLNNKQPLVERKSARGCYIL